MTEGKRRRRGEAKHLPAVYAQVSDEAKSTLIAVGTAMGNQALALDLILRSLELDSRGLPVGLDRDLFDKPEELPIPAA